MILGIDEVGRGPWAGPLVVGAVVLNEPIEGLTDSKKLSKKRREALDSIIREKAAGFGLGWVHADELDALGLSESLKLATIRAVQEVQAPYQEIIIDGTVNFLRDTGKGKYVTTMAKADLLIASVSAASIIAKVARDSYMAEQDLLYPGYGFGAHVGYGTAAHATAIAQLGLTPLHRTSFAPIKKVLDGTTKQIGDIAETIVAENLQRDGYLIVARNWKTRWCEIDIIAEKAGTIYFVEVKYRRNAGQGGGLAAITAKKLQQMKFAAEFYVSSHKLTGVDLRLAVAALTGQPPLLEEFLILE